MTRGWLSIALATAFGAFIGTVVSLEIAARLAHGSYFWGIGAFIGGMLAYIAIDFRHLCAGIAHSYGKTIAWRPHYLYWRALFAQWVGTMAAAASATVLAALFYVGVSCFEQSGDMSTLVVALLSAGWTSRATIYGTAALSVVVMFLAKPAARGSRRRLKTSAQYRSYLLWNIRDGWDLALNFNPVGILYWTLYWLAHAMIYLPAGIVIVGNFARNLFIAAVSTFCRFVAGVFIYAHSQRRTICFVDATIGAAIGYSFGSAIIGSIAGALLGIVNYELVSVRWLKLSPSSN